MQVKLLTVCQISFKFGLVKHILNKNTLHNGQEVVFMLETIFLNTHLQLNMQTQKNKNLQAMLFLVVFLNLMTFWIAQVSSLFLFLFQTTSNRVFDERSVLKYVHLHAFHLWTMNDSENTEIAEECEVLYEWIDGHITTQPCVYTQRNAALF